MQKSIQTASGKSPASQRIPADLKKAMHVHGQKTQTVHEKELRILLLKGNYRSEFPKSPSKKTNAHISIHPSLFPTLLH